MVALLKGHPVDTYIYSINQLKLAYARNYAVTAIQMLWLQTLQDTLSSICSFGRGSWLLFDGEKING